MYFCFLGGIPPHLYGQTNFGDNIDDEWFIVYLLFELSKYFPDLVIKWVNVQFLEQLHTNQQKTAEIEWFFYVVDNNLLSLLRRRWILTFVMFSWSLWASRAVNLCNWVTVLLEKVEIKQCCRIKRIKSLTFFNFMKYIIKYFTIDSGVFNLI